MVCVGPGRALQTHANFTPFSVPTEQLYNASIMTSRPRRRFSFSHSINKHVLSAFSSVPGLLLGPGAVKMKKPSLLTIPHHSSLTSQATCFVVSFPLQDSPRCSFYSARVKPGLTVLNLVWLFNLWCGDEGSLWKEKCSEHQMGLSDMEHRCYKLQKRQPIFFIFLSTHLKSQEKNHAISVVLEQHSHLKFCQSRCFVSGSPLW